MSKPLIKKEAGVSMNKENKNEYGFEKSQEELEKLYRHQHSYSGQKELAAIKEMAEKLRAAAINVKKPVTVGVLINARTGEKMYI